MPNEHATLSPSAAERWLECPASIRMESLVPPEVESEYAREGTIAHALAELKASREFGFITDAQFVDRRRRWYVEHRDVIDQDEVEVEMERHTDAYVDLLRDRMSLYPNSALLLEQRMDTGVPHCWGTGDAVICSPEHVEIVDFKYGAGVAVEAKGNPQLRLYALGAMDTFGDVLGETKVIRITVHQPRMNHVLTDEMDPDDLRGWREDIIPIAESALGDDAPFGPSDTACRWCPASGRCKAQLEEVFSVPFDQDLDTLSPDEFSAFLGKRKMVQDWLNAFEAAALDLAYSQSTPIPGYKVVLSGGIRSVKDQERALEVLLEEGFDRDEVSVRKVKGIGDLEKLLGKERFAELLEDPGIVQKSEGRPSLAPEDDKRPSISPNTEAAKDFA
jgi:hypothetical protein